MTMIEKPKREEGRALVVLGVWVLALTVLTSWSFRAYSVIAGSFRVDDVLICEELSGDMRPLPLGGDLSGGLKQACFWFTYSRAREGDVVELSWRYGDETVQRESFRLTRRSGMRAFYLLREDGSPLPAGEYAVTLLCNGREKVAKTFRLRAAEGEEEKEGEGEAEEAAASGDREAS